MAGRTTQHCYQNDRLYGQMRFAPLSAARQRIIICYNQHGMHVWILHSFAFDLCISVTHSADQGIMSGQTAMRKWNETSVGYHLGIGWWE